MFEKFTERARKVMSCARQEAQRLGSEFIGPEHILVGIMWEGGGVAAKVLHIFGATLKNVQSFVQSRVTPGTAPTSSIGSLPFTPHAKKLVEHSREVAFRFGHDVIGTEHLLVAMMSTDEGLAYEALEKLAPTDKIQARILEYLGIEEEKCAASSSCVPSTEEELFERFLEYARKLAGASGVGDSTLKELYKQLATVMDCIHAVRFRAQTRRLQENFKIGSQVGDGMIVMPVDEHFPSEILKEAADRKCAVIDIIRELAKRHYGT